jgi:pimeloyl-ACP methyl ester carboxylesterase
MSFLAIVGVAFALFLGSVSMVLFLIGPTLLLHPRRRSAEFYKELGRPVTPSDLGLAYEEINVIVAERRKLNSWLVKADAPVSGTLIYLHGVGDCKIDGLRFAALMHAYHYNVFLYDSRRHGASDGVDCTYGFFEKHDLSQIITYVLSRTDIVPGNIGAFGTSMGAAVAIQAAEIDSRIRAVAVENSFATLRTIFDDYQRRMIKVPFHYLRNIVITRSELMAKFKAREVSPLNSVAKIHIPILFIVGSEDRQINPRYSESLFRAANEPKEIFTVPHAGHMNVWDVAGAAYEQKLVGFFDKYLKTSA